MDITTMKENEYTEAKRNIKYLKNIYSTMNLLEKYNKQR